MSWFGADIGGTSVRIGLFDALDPDALSATDQFKVTNNYAHDLDNLVSAFRRLLDDKAVDGIGIGIPGCLDANRTGLVSSAHLSSWEYHDLKADLERAFDCAIELNNDADAGAIAEARFGEHEHDFWYLTWGTGIGGALVEPAGSGHRIIGGEPGHHLIDISVDAAACACGNRGCFEAYVGGKYIEQRTGGGAADTSPEVWKQVVGYMGIGIHNLIRIHKTSLLILSGGVTDKQPQLVPIIEAEANRLLGAYQQIKIERSRFGPSGNIYGALASLDL